MGTLGPPPRGAGTWREGFPALSEGRARDLTLHSWKLGQGPGPQRPTLTPGPVPLPGGPCRALLERAGHWVGPEGRGAAAAAALRAAWHLTLLRWGGSLAPPRRVSRPLRQLNTACGLSPHKGASSSKRGVRRPQRAGPSARPRGWPCAAPPLRSPSVHVGADRAGDAERLCGDGHVLVVHGAVVVGGDVGVEERHLHGAQAGRRARAQAARVEAQQQVQLVLDGLHLGAGRCWRRGLGRGRGLGRSAGPGRGAWPGSGDSGRRGSSRWRLRQERRSLAGGRDEGGKLRVYSRRET